MIKNKYTLFILTTLFTFCSTSFAVERILYDGKKATEAETNTANSSDLNSYEFSKNFGRGWNLGNTLEAIGGETAWGNPEANQQLFDALKEAGFNSVRLPVAWSKFTNESNYTIDTDWLDRVEEVVNYALNKDMYIILNEHWDEGWLQPTYEHQEEANARLAIMWEQIANHFKEYDNRLVFAGTNEVMVDGDYGTPTEEYYTVQNGFNQVFVNTVRATGGNNAGRYLAVQGFNTNINHTKDFFVMPNDEVEKKLIVEVHYYDPYNFTINENSEVFVWGDDQEGSESWANEAHADSQFQLMKTKFIDEGYGVIVGEYGAFARLELGNDLNQVHADNRKYWIQYITESIIKHGLVPYYWDNGYTSNHAFGLFDRNNGDQAYPELIEVIVDPSYVSIEDHSITTESTLLKVYPNPSANIINIEWINQQNTQAKLLDSVGRTVKTFEIKSGNNEYEINSIPTGVYFIQIKTNEGNETQKFIKQ